MDHLLPQNKRELEEITEEICRFLKSMEQVLEQLVINDFTWIQNSIKANYARIIPVLQDRLVTLSSSIGTLGIYQNLSQALSHLQGARSLFCGSSESNFLEQFLKCIHQLALAQYFLYELRSTLRCLDDHWCSSGYGVIPDYFLSNKKSVRCPVGFIHRECSEAHRGYTLYVPEYYNPDKKWPLIICLHGGGGRGDDYIWTWLRPARTKGYLVLSPKSVAFTWSNMGEDHDEISLMNILKEVREQYQVIPQKTLLTGLSDGGSYSFHLGFRHPELFAALAPVAGLLSGKLEGIKSLETAKRLPILQIHGSLDSIFPVGMARAVYQFLSRQGFNIIYEELSTWGHAFPYTINENIILPWFEGLITRD